MASTIVSVRDLILFGILILSRVDDISAKFPSGCPRCGKGESTLKAVAMLFRHGDRSPTMSYPLDPYRDYPWPGGYGALSERGSEEMYGSGLIKSTRYSSLLSIDCDSDAACTVDFDNILVFSSAVPRCVESAESFLDGFLRVDWPSDLINVIPQNQDEILAIPGKLCPKYESIIATGPSLDSRKFKKVIDFRSSKGQEFLAYLQNHTGLVIDSSTDILFIADTLFIDEDNDLELPAWTESVFEQYLLPILSIVYDALGSSQYMKIRSSALFEDMANRFDNLIEGLDEQNIVLYSAHDVTLNGMLHLLGIRDQADARPPYGASLNLELHDNSKIKSDYEVKLLYYGSYDDQNPTEIKIPKCRAPCPYKRFKRNIEPRLIDDYESACSL
ncbi:unnamed protein product [Hermetia illucens]|uniref:Acid phosphatase n=1 Tax=Hermetia illucens TaxID=343691 RepID=A0A7R8UQ28_HERIL|nr:lysosomal acid phosphatase-like [Hermetia illucens]CAD7084879.1 unnamed protein product [Hermetia illucens]